MNMNFTHCDHIEQHISLHDCVSERAYFENGNLGFEFNDGFWILPDHPESNFDKKPYHKECIIKISAPEVSYYWNNLCENRVW